MIFFNGDRNIICTFVRIRKGRDRSARGVGRPPKLKPRPYEAPALPDTQPPRGKEEIERATSSTVRVGRKKGAKSLAPAGKKTIFTSGDAEDDFDI